MVICSLQTFADHVGLGTFATTRFGFDLGDQRLGQSDSKGFHEVECITQPAVRQDKAGGFARGGCRSHESNTHENPINANSTAIFLRFPGGIAR